MQVIERPAPRSVPEMRVIGCLTNNRLAITLMDQIESGLVACDADGWILHANCAARREFGQGRALTVRDNVIQCGAEDRPQLEAALREAATRQRSRMVSLGSGAAPLMLVVTPLQMDDAPEPVVLLMFGRREVCSPLGLEMMAMRYGLTLAERRVLRAVLENLSVKEIADAHSVAITTVRTQIQSIRSKAGVRSIDALLVHAARMPPIRSRHDC